MTGDLPQVGDVLRVFEMYQCTMPPDENNYNLVIGKFTHALVTELRRSDFQEDNNIDVMWLEPEKLRLTYDREDAATFLSGKWDRFEVVSPDDWPDHICALVAKRKLMEGTYGTVAA